VIRPGLYGIADASFGDPVLLGRALLAGGAGSLQLRCKDWSVAEVAEAARALQPACRRADVPLILNDHLVLVAAGLGDGVHLGQDDGQVDRGALPPGTLVGRSTHDLAQVHGAEADYVGFGPVFETTTKAAGDARGLAALASACKHATVPVVAIGGVTLARLPRVQEAGAQAWAVIGAILRCADVAAAARGFAPSSEEGRSLEVGLGELGFGI